MNEQPVPPPPAPPTTPGDMRAYVSENRLLLAIIAGLTVVVLGLAGAWVAQNQVTVEEAQKVRDLRDTRDDLQVQLDTAQNRLEEVSAENEDRKSREADLAAAEAAVATRENELGPREADLKTREEAASKKESDLEAREVALRPGEDATWWVAGVQECLARGGDYINATVQESRVLGRDLSCYTG